MKLATKGRPVFVNEKTNKPAWLLEQTQEGEAIFTTDTPDESSRRRHTVPAHEFFSSHREASADEAGAFAPRVVQRQPMQQRPAKRTSAAPSKKRGPKSAAAPPAAPEPPAARQDGEQRQGGEPNGEKGTQTA